MAYNIYYTLIDEQIEATLIANLFSSLKKLFESSVVPENVVRKSRNI